MKLTENPARASTTQRLVRREMCEWCRDTDLKDLAASLACNSKTILDEERFKVLGEPGIRREAAPKVGHLV